MTHPGAAPRTTLARSTGHLAIALAALALVAGTLGPGRAGAQQPDSTVVVTPVPQGAPEPPTASELERSTSPGGAFVRALLLPGWGHAAIGAYTRGGFYFAAEATTGFLLAREIRRLRIAKDARDLREDRLIESLAAQGITSDSAVADALSTDLGVVRAHHLVRSRHQQVEDWAALTIFMVFLSGADAFVSAHLRDFPQPIPVSLHVAPDPATRAVGFAFSVPVGPSPPDR